MVVPVGQRYQQTLYLLRKTGGRMAVEALRPTLFVPMTGMAEARRQVQPDPANPAVINGDFEEVLGESNKPAGWHYQRQLELVADGDAPSGEWYVRFSNSEPGRGCRALQGFAVDGRKVKQLDVALQVRGDNIRPGLGRTQWPMLVISFYDEDRASVGEGVMGPWRGSFPWQAQSARIAVPPRAREAVIRIGLLGATGAISFDAVRFRTDRDD